MVRKSGLTSASIVYIDDFGFALGPDASRVDAERVLGMIQSLGFAANMDKTIFEPTTRIELLGFIIDTEAWLYGLPERRLRKLEATASGLLRMLEEDRLVALANEGPDAFERDGRAPARELARLAGQVMAMQSALGLVCRIRSRYVLHCVAPAAAAVNYGMLVGVPERARAEIELWANDLRDLPVMPLTPHTRVPEFRLEADASASAVAAILTDLGSGTEIERIHRELSEAERRKSSTLRELLGYANAVRVISRRHGGRLRGRLVEIVGDSQAAEAIFRKGGSQRSDADSGELRRFSTSSAPPPRQASMSSSAGCPASSWSTPMRSPSSMIGMTSA